MVDEFNENEALRKSGMINRQKILELFGKNNVLYF